MTLVNPPIAADDLHTGVKFTPKQYFFLSLHNMLGKGRTELINGEIVPMCSQLDLHAGTVTILGDYLRTAYPRRKFWVRVQMSLWCGANVPEPDLAVVNEPVSLNKAVMTSDRALLVAEVSDTTLLADLRTKPPIYAAAGIREYWVVDVNARQLVVHRDPVKSRGRWNYASVDTLDERGQVAPLTSKRRLRVETLFPARRGR